MSSRETRKFPHMWDTTLLEAKVLTERWRMDYNTKRPHSALVVSAAGGACGGSAAVFSLRSTRPAGQERLTLEPARFQKVN